jgi:hypothetical protein
VHYLPIENHSNVPAKSILERFTLEPTAAPPTVLMSEGEIMLKSFIFWLNSYVTRETPASILASLIGLLAFAGLLGTIFGNHAIRAGAFVVVIAFVVSAILLLLTDRRLLQRRYDVTHALLTRYSDFVMYHRSDPNVAVKVWNQVVYIQPDGDVNETIRIKAVALRPRVHLIRLTAGSRWDQPERYRRKVKIIARELTNTNNPGPRWDVTTSWISTQKMLSILHLREPIKRGQEIYFEIVRTWPAKCRPLMREELTDSFVFRNSPLLDVRHVDFKIVFPGGFDAVCEPIGHLQPNVHLSIDDERDDEGRRVFTWHADPIPGGEAVGIRLELSGSRS